MKEEDDECFEMDEIGSNDQEKGLPDEETVEPPMDTDTDGGEQDSSNEEHQENNLGGEQGAEEQWAEDPNETIEVELQPAEKVEHLSGAIEVTKL